MLVEAGRDAIEQNRRVAATFADRGIAVPTFVALPAAPPLCFMHIPKTGGASVIVWLESMFPANEVAPCRNTVDFEMLRGRTHGYRLFAGHFLGRQASLFPPDAQWMTIFRDPVETAASAYHHRRLAPKDDWEADCAQMPEGEALRGEDALDKWRAAKASSIFQDMDLLSALQQRPAILRPFFRDTLLRQLAATEEEDARFVVLDDESPELNDMRRRQWERATKLMDSIDLMGDHFRIEEFLLLVAATRGWPAPPSLPRIHDFGAPTKEDAAWNELRSQFKRYSPFCAKLYSHACDLCSDVDLRLEKLCGGMTATDVDALHRRRVFEESLPVVAFDTTADEAWNGRGWGTRERDGSRNPFRRFADGQSATTLVRLDLAIPEYRLFMHVWDASTEAVLKGLTASVSEEPLERVDSASRNGVLIVEWRLPSNRIASTHGNVEFVFAKDEGTRDDTLSISRIGCVPASTSG